jgi:hypothetical protein
MTNTEQHTVSTVKKEKQATRKLICPMCGKNIKLGGPKFCSLNCRIVFHNLHKKTVPLGG